VWAQQAVEFWNGFTNQMNREQVEARTKAVLGVDNPSYVYESGGALYSSHHPRDELTLYYEFGRNSDYDRILFYFVNSRLYYVSISFRSEAGSLIQAARNNYGNPTRVSGWNVIYDVYTWEFPNRIVTIPDSRDARLVIYDRQVQENFVREREREAEEARRREAKRIQF